MTHSTSDWTIAVHGGAGQMWRDTLTPAQDAAARAGLAAALDAGIAILAAGGGAVDAVAAAVRVLEDDASFNAGRGAVLSFEGEIDLDAAIMDGRDRAAGAVAATRRARHPIDLARAVMTDSPHVLLAGAGADRFGEERGLEPAPPGWFEVPGRRAQLDAMKADPDGWFDADMKYGTVGAVARDGAGHVAAATSTGGVTGKRWGRVGDTPLIGAGTYADDRAGAVSATGSGEYFIRTGVAHEVCARVRLRGDTPGDAATAVLAETEALGGRGGVILAGPGGEIGWRFTTPAMYRAKATADGDRTIAIYGDEE